MREIAQQLPLNQTQKVRLQAALQQLQELSTATSSSSSAIVTVADTIPVNHEDGILKGHGTSELSGEVVATLCGVVERINKLVYVRPLRASSRKGKNVSYIIVMLAEIRISVNPAVYNGEWVCYGKTSAAARQESPMSPKQRKYKPEVGDIIVGRVLEIAPKRWRLEVNFSQDAVLMLSSMNMPDGIQALAGSLIELKDVEASQLLVCKVVAKGHERMTAGNWRRRTAVDELNMRSIFEEKDVICAEVRGLQHDGSLQLQARSQKYGKHSRRKCLIFLRSKNELLRIEICFFILEKQKILKYNFKQQMDVLERGQLLTVPPYLVKRRKQHFHHLEQYGIDLIVGCNGLIWVGEHAKVEENETREDQDHKPENKIKTNKKSTTIEEQEMSYTPLETRENICRIANAVRVLSTLGFSLTVEVIIDTAEASASLNLEIKDMLGAEFHVQIAEREARRRKTLSKKKG
ncbi:hypothetical protein ACLOJK_018642 [Asimina triloba]